MSIWYNVYLGAYSLEGSPASTSSMTSSLNYSLENYKNRGLHVESVEMGAI